MPLSWNYSAPLWICILFQYIHECQYLLERWQKYRYWRIFYRYKHTDANIYTSRCSLTHIGVASITRLAVASEIFCRRTLLLSCSLTQKTCQDMEPTHSEPHMDVDPILWNCVGSRSYELKKNLDKTAETELICHLPLHIVDTLHRAFIWPRVKVFNVLTCTNVDVSYGHNENELPNTHARSYGGTHTHIHTQEKRRKKK